MLVNERIGPEVHQRTHNTKHTHCPRKLPSTVPLGQCQLPAQSFSFPSVLSIFLPIHAQMSDEWYHTSSRHLHLAISHVTNLRFINAVTFINSPSFFISQGITVCCMD